MTTAVLYFVTEVAMSLVRMFTTTISLVRMCMCMCLRARERERRERSKRNAWGENGVCEAGVPDSTDLIAQAAHHRRETTHSSQCSESSNFMQVGRTLPVDIDMELESAVGFFSPKRVAEVCEYGVQENIDQRRFKMGLRWLLKTCTDQGQAAQCDEFSASPQSEILQNISRDPIVCRGCSNSLHRASISELPSCTVAWSESGSCSVAHEMQEQATAEVRLRLDLEGLEDDEGVRTPEDDKFETQSSLDEDAECCSELRSACECSPLPNQTLPSPAPRCPAASQCRMLQEDFEAEEDLVADHEDVRFPTNAVESARMYMV